VPPPPPPLKLGEFFSGNFYVKFGHLGAKIVNIKEFCFNFSGKYNKKLEYFDNFSGKNHVKFRQFVNFYSSRATFLT